MARVPLSNGSGWVGDIGGKEQREKGASIFWASLLWEKVKDRVSVGEGGTDRYVLEVTTQLGPQ